VARAEAPVRIGVHLTADPKMSAVEQPEGRRQHPVLTEVAVDEMLRDELPGSRKGCAEAHHPLELLGVPAGGPFHVVEVLLAPCSIDAGGLDVSIGPR